MQARAEARSRSGGKIGQHSPGRPTGRLGATAQLCAPRTLCCEVFELLRFRPGPVQPSSGPKLTRPAPSPQWAHQSNLGRASIQRCPDLESDGANPFCTTAVPPTGWSVRAAPTRSGHILLPCRERAIGRAPTACTGNDSIMSSRRSPQHV